MQGLNRWHRLTIVTVGLMFLAVCLLQSLTLSPSAAAAVNTTADEARMIQLVNQARNNAGLPSLYAEQRLTDFARSYSSEMIQYNFFGHVSPVSGDLKQRIKARGISGWKLAGENLAKAPSVDAAFTALMNSAGHRENILRAEFNCIGVGIVQGPGCLYITQEFMQFSPIPATADVPVASPPPAQTAAASPDSFDSYILIMNPNDTEADVDVTFQGEDKANHSYHYQIAGNSRFTVPVRETMGCGSFATDIKSSVPVLAERAMYFKYQGRTGGHGSIGTERPSLAWFFAEGYTGDTFDTWILLQNPNPANASVNLTFMQPDGAAITKTITVDGSSRRSVHVDEISGLESADVSTQVTSDLPIVAERAMYFNYQGKDGGSETIGASSPSNKWLFAEGYTGDSFDTWLLLQNPNDDAANVELDFMRSDGSVISKTVNVPGRKRFTLHIDEIPGLESTEVSTQVNSDRAVVAERAMYFNYEGSKKGGHVTIGATEPRDEWYLAEGYTGGDFDDYVLLLNPGDATANVDIVFMRPDGIEVNRQLSLQAHSRFTIHVDELSQLESTEVSTKITSDNPIVVERAEYFNFRGLRDGSNSIGSSEPSVRWYFAEGFVK
ncbi:MAG: hypothetical protein A2V52_08170 [Actinobacteria bacterium RBG_19FT_COMBO_54_7]|uniref:SCP domain-containing protein n=1 Tax=Candidatus Solincola sediminis TaxID=1797199 RepID=A0A1F2WRV1_9ACTN|nr:MAG: hypothetical protein A2Y75_01375 [Candidatus Solincola sediminis]OFW67679.1 MAG: hypothetical protein A2V52_08170 [Actinobacteria bacterium RBG_19FT_COMBO_54_7]